MPAAYRVYVLQNVAGRFYIGISEDIPKRLVQHNANASRWTKRKGPREWVWESELLPLNAARKLENGIKRQGRGSGFYSITGLNRTTGS